MTKTKVPILCGLALLAVIVTGGAIYNALANGRLERKIAALCAAGQPVELADLAHEPIEPESNAATYLRQARPHVEAIERDVSARIDAAPKADQERFDQGYLSPQLKDAIRLAFEPHPALMGLLEQAAACPDYDSQLELNTDAEAFQNALSVRFDINRNVIRVLSYRALAEIDDGQSEDALKTCLLMFRLCRHFDREPTVISNLVAIACRSTAVARTNQALRIGSFADVVRDELDAELARHETDKPFLQALISERALGVQDLHELRQPLGLAQFGLFGLTADTSDYLDLMENAISLTGLTYANAMNSRSDYYQSSNQRPVVMAVLPQIERTLAANCRVRAQMRALRVLNALARHPQIAESKEPKLADLGLPIEATIDPFDGQPLRLQKQPGGWLIYAVGKNLRDDGGQISDAENQQDYGIGPQIDIAVRRD